MGVYNASWEDEENNRIVELAVEYRMDDDQLDLVAITPLAVTFFDPATKLVHRKIKVWTNTGRKLLARAYHERIGTETLERELTDSLLLAQ